MKNKKTYDKKMDFIEFLASATNVDLNDFIKKKGSKTKLVPLVVPINKDDKK